jgi:hypothetical protein
MSEPSKSPSSLLKSARDPFLKFLRNLTPQIFLASMAWIVGVKLNFYQRDFTNWLPTLMFFGFLVMFGYACYASASIFFEEAFADLNRWLKDQDQIIKQPREAECSKPKLFETIFRERKLDTAIAIIVIIFLELLFTGLIASSFVASVNFLNLTHK